MGRRTRRTGGAASRHNPLQRTTEQLNLTPEQKAKVQPIIDQATPQIQNIRHEAMQKTKAVMDNAMAQIRPLLTPDQQKKLDDAQNDRHGGRGGHGVGAENAIRTGKTSRITVRRLLAAGGADPGRAANPVASAFTTEPGSAPPARVGFSLGRESGLANFGGDRRFQSQPRQCGLRPSGDRMVRRSDRLQSLG